MQISYKCNPLSQILLALFDAADTADILTLVEKVEKDR
jgi:hypothetical protein